MAAELWYAKLRAGTEEGEFHSQKSTAWTETCNILPVTGITLLMPVGRTAPNGPSPDATPRQIAAARAGSTDALGGIYRLHADMVFGAAYRITLSEADAEDVLQDVFVGLPEALRSYDERGTFASWLKAVAVRTALMRLRSQRRLREGSLDSASTPTSARPTALDRAAARDAIARLPEALRVVFMLSEVEGYTHAEISALLDISAGASATRLHRAWRAILEEDLP